MLLDMSMTMEEVTTHFAPYITHVDEKQKIIIMENTPAWLGDVVKSDIICIFHTTGEMLVLTERTYKSRVPWWSWLVYKWKVRQMQDLDCAGTTDTSVTVTDGVININRYKVWWINWINELRDPSL